MGLWLCHDRPFVFQSSQRASCAFRFPSCGKAHCDSLQKTDGKKKEISKDVSAFANSAGGTIIYGVEEDKHFPTSIDNGFDPRDISKEWIEQVINSTINRRIDGIRIKEIALSGAKNGRSIYAVSIPQSRRAPHMAADKRYYKRFNFESVPMEDYEVRDVSRRLESRSLHFFSAGAWRRRS